MKISLPFRKRMMVLFCSVVGLLLIGSHLVLYFLVARMIHRDFDGRLLETATTLSDDLARYIASPDDITEVDTPGQIFEIFDEQGNPLALSRGLHGHPLEISFGHREGQSFKPQTFHLARQGAIRAVPVPVRSAPITELDRWSVIVPSNRGGTLEVCRFNVVQGIDHFPAPASDAPDHDHCLSSTADDAWHSATMPATETGKFTVSFDATPSLVTDARIGFSQGEQSESAAFPILIVFNSSGLIQARNGSVKQGSLPYRAGQTYHFRLLIDVPALTYSVWVAAANKTGQEIGTNFSFHKSRDWTLVVARSTREPDASLAELRGIVLFLLVSNLLVVGAVSTLYVRRSLRPLSNLTEKVTSLACRLRTGHPSPGKLFDQRLENLPVDSGDELRQLAEAFNQLTVILNDTFQQMRQFISDASHELRTPLSILRGEAELLLRRPRSPEEYKETVTVIHAELKHLADIVEGLFTLSMADAGQLRIARESLYLNDLLEEACLLVGQRAAAKGIKIERSHAEEVLSNGDDVLLKQLFLILLDNAVKYSLPHTFIRVGLRAEDGTAVITFEDQAIGIPAEHIPHIFERFYRVPAADGDDVQGAGLGLAIAQAIAHAHGGAIECASVPAKGSVFTVRLPREVKNIEYAGASSSKPGFS